MKYKWFAHKLLIIIIIIIILSKWLNSSIWPIGRTTTGTINLSQGRARINVKGEVLYIPLSSRTRASPPDIIVCYSQDTFWEVLLLGSSDVHISFSPQPTAWKYVLCHLGPCDQDWIYSLSACINFLNIWVVLYLNMTRNLILCFIFVTRLTTLAIIRDYSTESEFWGIKVTMFSLEFKVKIDQLIFCHWRQS